MLARCEQMVVTMVHARTQILTDQPRNATRARPRTQTHTHTAGEANYAGQLDRAATLRLKGEEITWQERTKAEARGQARWGCPFTDRLSVCILSTVVLITANERSRRSGQTETLGMGGKKRQQTTFYSIF